MTGDDARAASRVVRRVGARRGDGAVQRGGAVSALADTFSFFMPLSIAVALGIAWYVRIRAHFRGPAIDLQTFERESR